MTAKKNTQQHIEKKYIQKKYIQKKQIDKKMDHRCRKLAVALQVMSLIIGFAATSVSQAADKSSAGEKAPATSSAGNATWGAAYFPNVELTTHEGEKVRFFDDLVKGKVVVINFIYTSCPDVCPLETARMAEVYAILQDRVGKDTFFYSITIDPEVDTPAVLKEYAQRYRAGDGWTFLTGSDADITLLRRKLGLYIEDIQGEDTNDHNVNLVIGNQGTGRWMKRSPFENPYVLAEQISGWLHNWKDVRTENRDYAEAPALRDLVTGESLFRTRCSACHTVGGGDLNNGPGAIGPDLFGAAERRDREWLEKWLAAPDEMIAQGDPIATTLFEAFDRVPMPNLRLTPKDIASLIQYMEIETRRVESTRLTQVVIDEVQKSVEEGELPSCCQKGGNGTVTDRKPAPVLAQQPQRQLNIFATVVFLGGLSGALGLAASLLRSRSGQ